VYIIYIYICVCVYIIDFFPVVNLPEVSGSLSSNVPWTKLSHKTIKITAYMGKVTLYLGQMRIDAIIYFPTLIDFHYN